MFAAEDELHTDPCAEGRAIFSPVEDPGSPGMAYK